MRALSSNLPFFKEEKSIDKLNHLLAISSSLMPHQVAAATGCPLEEALSLLLLLFEMSLYDASLLVYHVAHEDGPPFMKRAIEDGLPSLPITCDLCERPISKREELSYDFLFTRLESVEILD